MSEYIGQKRPKGSGIFRYILDHHFNLVAYNANIIFSDLNFLFFDSQDQMNRHI